MDLHYKQYGDSGDAVFILHGVFGMLDNWHNIAGKLSDKYRVFSVDQRNHGHSPHSPEMTFEAMADDLAQLMDKLGISNAHIIGHSMGGKTAMQFAANHPGRMKSLVVVDIAPKGYEGGHEVLMDALQKADFEAATSRSDAEDRLARYISDKNIRLFLLKNLQHRKEGGYHLKMNLPVIREHYEQLVGPVEINWPITGPALFMRGEKSDYIRDEDRQDIRASFPDAQFVTVPGTGHWLHAENPDGFLEALNGFLDSLD